MGLRDVKYETMTSRLERGWLAKDIVKNGWHLDSALKDVGANNDSLPEISAFIDYFGVKYGFGNWCKIIYSVINRKSKGNRGLLYFDTEEIPEFQFHIQRPHETIFPIRIVTKCYNVST